MTSRSVLAIISDNTDFTYNIRMGTHAHPYIIHAAFSSKDNAHPYAQNSLLVCFHTKQIRI